MKASIVCIGDEVLNGKIVNTNASYLAKQLFENGFNLKEQLVISDYEKSAKQIFIDLAKDNKVVLVTGGLGPTVDDLTRRLIADLVQKPLKLDETLYQELCKKYKEHPYHKIQATVPESVEQIKNPVGTACGFYCEINTCHYFFMPGVPQELHYMFENPVLEKLKTLFQDQKKSFENILHLFDLIEVELDPALLVLKEKHPNLDIGIYPSYGQLKVVLSAKDKAIVDEASKMIVHQFEKHLYESISGRLDEAVFNLLLNQKATLGVAESITGGTIASKLVANPGVSSCFLGSLVTYSNKLKTDLLACSEKLLKEHGAVSFEVAEAMAQGVLKTVGSDFSLATTGIAGPSGGEHKSVGTVFIAAAHKSGKKVVRKFEFTGDRAVIIEKASNYAMGVLYSFIKSI
jgi:nicotinamide-nucleotide amidase